MNPSARLIGITQPYDDADFDTLLPLFKPVDIIEFAGRWDYGQASVNKIGDPEIVARWLASGEESMVEMVDAVFLITCSRVVSHELVRHRIASYQQESQRFVSYADEDPDDLFFLPPGLDEAARQVLLAAYKAALDSYLTLRSKGVSKQIARYVLPNATRTRVVAKMNLREWRHVLKLRTHTSAQPEMRAIMLIVAEKLRTTFGETLFPTTIGDERGTR